MPIKCSVIIINYNGLKFLENCLDSLRKTKYNQFEVILVDNGSSDGSANYIEKNYPWVKVIRLKKNVGFAMGNIIGFKYATGDYIVLLNNDTIVHEDWLKELVKTAEMDEKIGIVGALIIPIKYKGKKPYIISEVTDVACVIGAAMLIKRKLIDDVGFFDPDFFIFFEDEELCLKAVISGYRVVFSPNAYVYHVGSGTMGGGIILPNGTITKDPKVWFKNGRFNKSVYFGVRNQVSMGIKIFDKKYILQFLKKPWSVVFHGILKRNPYQVVSGLLAIIWLSINFGKIIIKRREIQKRKIYQDQKIFKLLKKQESIYKILNSL
jgi:glycosyltransferase involved in cell wall biosynthesis